MQARLAVFIVSAVVFSTTLVVPARAVPDNASQVVIKLDKRAFEESERITGHYTAYFWTGSYWLPLNVGWCPTYWIYRKTSSGLKQVQEVSTGCTNKAEVKIRFRLEDDALTNAQRGKVIRYVLKAFHPGHHETKPSTARKGFDVIAE